MNRLKKVSNKEDIKALFGLMDKISEWDKPLNSLKFNNYLKFENSLINLSMVGVHDLFLIVDNGNNIIGFIYAYEFRNSDLNCKMHFFYKDHINTKALNDVLNSFCEYMFREYPLIKIFAYCSNLNSEFVTCFEECKFSKECILQDYYFIDSKHYDCVIWGRERK